MSATAHRPALGTRTKCRRVLAVVSASVLITLTLYTAAYAGQAAATGQPAAPTSAPAQRVPLDRVVAIVNGDLILESDLAAEQRLAAFQPFSESGTSRDDLINRLIDRALILQQLRLQPEPAITDAEVDAQLATLRKGIPACATYHCETDAGWAKFLADHGVTLDELKDRWRMELEVLRFIDERFRMGIRILQPEIDEYYQKTMVPMYQKQKTEPPAESTVTERVRELLLQQRVTSLLDDWLKALRAQGSVRIVKPGEALP
jgi:peptidyl-prolyl cis-trans isomerase SurA